MSFQVYLEAGITPFENQYLVQATASVEGTGNDLTYSWIINGNYYSEEVISQILDVSNVIISVTVTDGTISVSRTLVLNGPFDYKTSHDTDILYGAGSLASGSSCVAERPPVPQISVNGTTVTVTVPDLPTGADSFRLEIRELPVGNWTTAADGITIEDSVNITVDLCSQYEIRWVAVRD